MMGAKRSNLIFVSSKLGSYIASHIILLIWEFSNLKIEYSQRFIAKLTALFL